MNISFIFMMDLMDFGSDFGSFSVKLNIMLHVLKP